MNHYTHIRKKITRNLGRQQEQEDKKFRASFFPKEVAFRYNEIFMTKQATHDQCDQIGRFIGLWATLKPLATIILSKSPTFFGNFFN